MELLHRGKVRDVYLDGEQVILVASDRISVYDVVLPTEMPGKGKLLTQISAWWFEQLAELTPNHLISTADVPAQFAGRALRCRRLRMLPVECVARGYLAGAAFAEYRSSGTVGGVPLPPGLALGSRLPEPLFTPTTKETAGEHDRPMTFRQLASAVGTGLAGRLRDTTLEIYWRATELAAERGVIVADTKIELGWDSAYELVLADEVLTPDSSRFWLAEQWRPGRSPTSYDKQLIRDWAAAAGWDRRAPAPEAPRDVLARARRAYIEVYERITGRIWPAAAQPRE